MRCWGTTACREESSYTDAKLLQLYDVCRVQRTIHEPLVHRRMPRTRLRLRNRQLVCTAAHPCGRMHAHRARVGWNRRALCVSHLWQHLRGLRLHGLLCLLGLRAQRPPRGPRRKHAIRSRQSRAPLWQGQRCHESHSGRPRRCLRPCQSVVIDPLHRTERCRQERGSRRRRRQRQCRRRQCPRRCRQRLWHRWRRC